MNASFEKLAQQHGRYSLPYLIKLHDSENKIFMRFVNDTKNVTFNGKLYTAGTFRYTPNASEQGFSGGGSLEISVQGNAVIDLIETYRDVRLEVVGCIMQDGTIIEVKSFRHHYGKVKTDRATAKFTFEKDDRLSMTFPALIWSAFNNRGNA